ncbi:MAG: YigZ family protein [Treponema sp.]|nr:YigZ family protein [Treponema sp.]
MDILTCHVQTETIIKNSRFIAELIPCESQAQARELLKNQKIKYADATHVCHAFVLGSQGEVLGMSDAGEPSGTAGRPMLDVLKGRHCTGALLTVTRYFGGTLLGTGGLVKAYGGCAKSVIEQADAEHAFEQLVAKSSFSFVIPYPLYELVKRQFTLYHVSDVTESFTADVAITGKIYASEAEQLALYIRNLTNGSASVVISG